MKSLTNYISEKLVINKNFKRNDYFVYEINETDQIKIFSNGWSQFDEYKDKVYINGEHVELDDIGFTYEEYSPGEYLIEIKDINNVTDCYAMFLKCENLTKVPLFDTTYVKNMGSMFQECHNLTEVPLFDTRNVTNMENMFNECKHLKNVPLFDTRKVIYMNAMFAECNDLTKVPLFDTRKVKYMNAMFIGCRNITEVPLFNTRKVQFIGSMFANCTNLSEQTKQRWSKIYDFEKDDKI